MVQQLRKRSRPGAGAQESGPEWTTLWDSIGNNRTLAAAQLEMSVRQPALGSAPGLHKPGVGAHAYSSTPEVKAGGSEVESHP